MRMAYLIALIWLLSPVPASAGPAIAWIAANWVVAAQIALTVGSIVYGAAQQRRQQRAAKDAYNASLKDRAVTVVTGDAPFRYVYGRARVGSLIINMLKSGDKDQYKHLVCVHANHECDAIEEIYIAGKALGPLDANGGVTTGDYVSTKTQLISEFHTGISFDLENAPTSLWVVVDYGGDNGQEEITPVSVVGKTVTLDQDYSLKSGTVHCTYPITITTPHVSVQKHLGVPGDPVDAYLHGLLPDEWTATDTVDGCCYTIVTLDLNQPEFQTGVPSIEVLLRGKKLYDLRTGITAWSQSPPLAIRDYLTSEMCGVDAADIPDADVIAAANVCDQVVGGASLDGSGPLYTLNGAVSADQDQSTVLEQMAQAMAGGIVATTWRMWAGAYTAPVLTLDETDIIGQIAITPGMSDADIYNGVKGQFIGATNSYVATDFPPYQNATYVAADGGQEKWTNIDLLWTDDPQRCANLARIFIEDQRNGYTVKADFSLKTWGVQIGERVTLSSTVFGWSNKAFRVTDKQYSPTSAVTLTLKEDDPSIWDLADAVTPDSTQNTNLPDPFQVSPLALLTCTSGTGDLLLQADGTIVSRIHVSWPASTDQAANHGVIDVEWIAVGSTIWNRLQVSGESTDAYLAPVSDGVFYTVRARLRNQSLNVSADWVYQTHRVIGKSAPPTDIPWFSIEGNTLSWGTVSDIDLAGYRIRFHYGSNRSWGDAHPLHAGLITHGPFTPEVLPQGQVTLMLKAVDTSGNESASAAVILSNFGDMIVANVVESFDFVALGYPGTITDGDAAKLDVDFVLDESALASTPAIVDGVLQADNIASFYRDDSSKFYSDHDGDTFYNDNFGGLAYETEAIMPTLAEVGSNMTLDVTLTGNARFIEYRTFGEEQMFSTVDADPFFEADSDPFYPLAGDYQPWPGQVAAKSAQYQFRFSAARGPVQATLPTCKVLIDVPDLLEQFNDLAVPGGGVRLPITLSYHAIENVKLTLQDSGGTALSARTVDKSAALGPLVKCFDASGASVAGVIDAEIQGY